MSYESGDDLALRERYARELLNMTDEMSYDNSQRKFILEFSERIFRLNDPKMSNELREAYDMKTVPLRELSIELSKEEGILIGEEKGKEEGKIEGKIEGKAEKAFDVARSMLADGLPAETIGKYTGLDENSILSLM
jgi:predicted transposase/invertase (TIGR01784 family)